MLHSATQHEDFVLAIVSTLIYQDLNKNKNQIRFFHSLH